MSKFEKTGVSKVVFRLEFFIRLPGVLEKIDIIFPNMLRVSPRGPLRSPLPCGVFWYIIHPDMVQREVQEVWQIICIIQRPRAKPVSRKKLSRSTSLRNRRLRWSWLLSTSFLACWPQEFYSWY